MDLIYKNKLRKIAGFFAFVATGSGLFLSRFISDFNISILGILMFFGVFYYLGIIEYYKELMDAEEQKKLYKSYIVLFSTFTSVIITWVLNHKVGLGPIVANGIVGVLAVFLLPKKLSGMVFTSSFVGMSSLAIIPNIAGAGLGGIVVGLVILVTGEVFAGIGGKGGTTAALSTIITKNILNLFI